MKKWYKSEAAAETDAKKENCRIVVASNGHGTDIYYLVPNNAEKGKIYRIITRSSADCGGKYCYRVIYIDHDGNIEIIDEATKYRIEKVKRGDIPKNKIVEYLKGYYTLNEERSAKIKERKERARISHELCDIGGKEGHRIRQDIRRHLANTRKGEH